MNTGCVKIYRKAEEYTSFGEFIPLHKRGPETQLFRGILSLLRADIRVELKTLELWISRSIPSLFVNFKINLILSLNSPNRFKYT